MVLEDYKLIILYDKSLYKNPDEVLYFLGNHENFKETNTKNLEIESSDGQIKITTKSPVISGKVIDALRALEGIVIDLTKI